MVAEANNRRSAAIYQVRSFRSQDAIGALVALARKAGRTMNAQMRRVQVAAC